MKESFVFYKSWMDAVRAYDESIRLEVYEATLEYATSGLLTRDLRPVAKMAFSFIKQDIDRSNKNYEKTIVARNRENGKNGGRPRKVIDYERVTDNPKNPVGFSETQKTLNDNDNENDNVLGNTVSDETGITELPNGNSSDSFSFQPKNKTRARSARVKQVLTFETAKYGEFEPAIKCWLEYKAGIKDTYKIQRSVDTMARNLWKLAGGKPDVAMQIVEQSIGNNWKGLFELKNRNGNANGNSKNTNCGFNDEYKADILRRMGAI
jgi:hypothetical protein